MESVAIPKGISPPREGKGPGKSPLVERLCSSQKAEMLQRYGAYPEDHPLTVYLRSLPIAKEHPGIAITVLRRYEEPDALSFPDGTIFISDRLFGFCEFREELEFILQHEIRHIEGRHSEKAMGEGPGIARLGRSRMHEYEADIAKMLEDGDNAANPLGGIIFFNRMAKSEGHRSGLVHGDTYVRLAGIEYAVRLVEMDSLDPDLDRIPADIRESTDKQRDLWSMLARPSEHDAAALHGAADGIGFLGAIACYKAVHSSDIPDDAATSLLVKLGEKIKAGVRERYPGSSEGAVKAMSAYLIFHSPMPMVFDKGGSRKSGLSGRGSPDPMLCSMALDSGVFFKEVIGMLSRYPKDFPICMHPPSDKDFFIMAMVAAQKEFGVAEAYPQMLRIYDAMKGDCLLPEPGRYIDERMALLLMRSFDAGKEGCRRFLERMESDGLSPNLSEIMERLSKHFKVLQRDVIKAVIESRLPDLQERYPQRTIDKAVLVSVMVLERHEERSQEFLSGTRFMEVASPSSLEDFCGFLRATNEIVDLLVGEKRHRQMHLGDFMETKILKSLFRRLKLSRLSNHDAISLLEAGRFSQDMAYLLGMKDRIYTKEELERLFAIMPEGMATIIITQLHGTQDRRDVFELLDLLTGGSDGRISSGQGTLFSIANQVGTRFTDDWNDVASLILNRFRFDMEDPRQLDQLLSVSCLISDPNLKLRLQKSVLRKLAPMLGHGDSYALLFWDRRVADYAATEAREDFLDKRVPDPEELERIKQDIIARISGIEGKMAGAAVLEEAMMGAVLRDKERLLKSLLSSRKSNAGLRKHLAEAYLAGFLGSRGSVTALSDFIEEFYKTRASGDTTIVEDIPLGRYLYEFENLLFNLDYESRFLLCQQLLIGEGGVLLDKAKRERVLKWFFEEFVSKPTDENERKVRDFLKKALFAVSENADVPTLYFLIQPVMVERILGRPKRNFRWGSALEHAKRKALSKISDQEEEYYLGESLDDAIGVIEALNADEYAEHGDDGGPWERRYDRARAPGFSVYEEELATKRQATVIGLNTLCEPYLGGVPETVSELSAIEFVKHLSSNLGAPGVRFLQALGIYADIPPSLRDEFDDVYDNVLGQLKLSAVHTLRKSWNGGEVDGLDELQERIGGGSVVTVYKGKVHGEGCVVKVVNPNVAFRAGRICDNLSRIFASDDSLKRAIPLLDNIRAWIEADAGFSGSGITETFFAQNHGFSVSGNRYTIHVPQILKGREKFMAEEFVDGKNLTKWDELSKTHDMKAIVSLLVKNTVHQVSNGLVHADIHIGNIRVTGDNKVALLDRNYLLVLSGEDKRFLGSLVFLHQDKANLAKAIGEYLCGSEENKDVDKEALTAKLSEVMQANGHRDVGSFVSDCVAVVSEHDAVFPLNVMLLLKNALALERMAKRAGFSNVLEAFMA